MFIQGTTKESSTVLDFSVLYTHTCFYTFYINPCAVTVSQLPVIQYIGTNWGIFFFISLYVFYFTDPEINEGTKASAHAARCHESYMPLARPATYGAAGCYFRDKRSVAAEIQNIYVLTSE